MIGVTIGVGEKHSVYAEYAAKQFEKHTKLNTLILGADALRAVAGHRIFDEAYNLKTRSCLLKFFIPHFVGREDFVYFDNDYVCVADWSPEKESNGLFSVVKDRTGYLLEAKRHLCVPHESYFNSGMIIVPSEVGFKITNRCLRDHDRILRHFYDQCTWNHAVHSMGIDVNYLDRRFNCMNYSGEFVRYDIRAIHCSSNYGFAESGDIRIVTPELGVNKARMLEIGEKSDRFSSEGTTKEGNCWFFDDVLGINVFDYQGKQLSVN